MDWFEWGDETLVYACDDTYGCGMFLFWADMWLDGSDTYHAIMFGVENGYVREFADADGIVVDTLEAAEEYLLEEGMTDEDVVQVLHGEHVELGEFDDYDSAKEAIEAWIAEH